MPCAMRLCVFRVCVQSVYAECVCRVRGMRTSATMLALLAIETSCCGVVERCIGTDTADAEIFKKKN